MLQKLETTVPPALLFGICSGIIWLISNNTDQSGLQPILKYGGTGLFLLLGAISGMGGIIFFKRAKTTVDPLQPEKASALVTTGIYQVTRNPMYLGLAFGLVAVAFWFGSVWSLSVIPVFILYMNRFQIIPEERALEKKFGEEFKAYKSKVRRWV